MVEFEEVLETVGGFGKYQLFQYFFCYHLMKIASLCGSVAIIFQLANPDHWCATPDLEHLNITQDIVKNLTIPYTENDGYSQCQQYERDYRNWTLDDVEQTLSYGQENVTVTECKHGWQYDRTYHDSSVITEWDLVCGSRWWVAVGKSIYLLGYMVGLPVFGYIADRWGRKKSYCAGVVVRSIVSFITPFSPNYACFLAMRMVAAASFIGLQTAIYTLMLEMVTPSWRGFIVEVISYVELAESVVAVAVAYYIRDWRHLSLLMMGICVIQLINFYTLTESPRWLYSQGRNKEGDVIMKRMAKINGKSHLLPDDIKVEVKHQKSLSFIQLFRSGKLRIRMAIMYLQWIAVTAVGYALYFGMIDFGGNPYISYSMGMLIQIPEGIVSLLCIRFVNRRIHLTGLWILCAVAVIIIPFVSKSSYVGILTLNLIGRGCSSGAFNLIYLYTTELLPTSLRTTGLSSASFVGRFGGISSQYLMGTMHISRYIPYLTLGGVCIIALILVLPLPETRGRKLPEEIEEIEQMGRNIGTERNEEQISQNEATEEEKQLQTSI